MKTIINIKWIALIFFKVSICFGANIDTYFFPPGYLKYFVDQRELPQQMETDLRDRLLYFDVFRQFDSHHSVKQETLYADFTPALDLFMEKDPNYLQKISEKPERLSIDIVTEMPLTEDEQLLQNHRVTARLKLKDYLKYELRALVPRLERSSLEKLESFYAVKVFKETNFSYGAYSMKYLAKIMIYHWIKNLREKNIPLSYEALVDNFDFNVLKQMNKTISADQNIDLRSAGEVTAYYKRFKYVFEPARKEAPPRFLRLVELPMYLMIHRGGCVGDCSTTSSKFFPLMPGEFSFYVQEKIDNEYRYIGYVTATLVENENRRYLLIKDIVGKSSAMYFAKEVVFSFLQLKEYYQVDGIALMSKAFVQNNHFKEQQRALMNLISSYTKGTARKVHFLDNDLRVALNSGNSYDLETQHQNIRIVQEASIEAEFKNMHFESSPITEPLSKKELKRLLLKAPGISFVELEVLLPQANIKRSEDSTSEFMHELSANRTKFANVDYFKFNKKLEALVSRFRLDSIPQDFELELFQYGEIFKFFNRDIKKDAMSVLEKYANIDTESRFIESLRYLNQVFAGDSDFSNLLAAKLVNLNIVLLRTVFLDVGGVFEVLSQNDRNDIYSKILERLEERPKDLNAYTKPLLMRHFPAAVSSYKKDRYFKDLDNLLKSFGELSNYFDERINIETTIGSSIDPYALSAKEVLVLNELLSRIKNLEHLAQNFKSLMDFAERSGFPREIGTMINYIVGYLAVHLPYRNLLDILGDVLNPKAKAYVYYQSVGLKFNNNLPREEIEKKAAYFFKKLPEAYPHSNFTTLDLIDYLHYFEYVPSMQGAFRFALIVLQKRLEEGNLEFNLREQAAFIKAVQSHGGSLPSTLKEATDLYEKITGSPYDPSMLEKLEHEIINESAVRSCSKAL